MRVWKSFGLASISSKWFVIIVLYISTKFDWHLLLCSSGWIRKQGFLINFIVEHQRRTLIESINGEWPITCCVSEMSNVLIRPKWLKNNMNIFNQCLTNHDILHELDLLVDQGNQGFLSANSGLCYPSYQISYDCRTEIWPKSQITLCDDMSSICKLCCLTHWGRVKHICVGKLTTIGSDNGLSPGRRQAIIWTNAGILLIWPLGTNFNEMLIEIHTFSFKKMHLNMSSAKMAAILSRGRWVN